MRNQAESETERNWFSPQSPGEEGLEQNRIMSEGS